MPLIQKTSSVSDCTVVPKPTDCPVTVTQGYVDRATQAFNEVVALRDAVAKCGEQAKLSAAERQAVTLTLATLNDAIKVRDQLNSAQDRLILMYDKIIKLQDDLINKLVNQLNKPRSFFQKFLDQLKNIALIAVGVTLGRGL